MKIEAGKYYLRADGRKAGPAEPTGSDTYPFNVPYGNGHLFHGYTSEGVSCISYKDALLIAEWHDTETGTLKELNVKPGDVVEFVRASKSYDHIYSCHAGYKYKIDEYLGAKSEEAGSGGGWSPENPHVFRIISRASNTDDTPKTWGEMTDAEKGALALARYRNQGIEYHSSGMNVWCDHDGCYFMDNFAYRVRPEPKREIVKLWWERGCVAGRQYYDDATHRITFDLVDGKPDLDSIKMEEL